MDSSIIPIHHYAFLRPSAIYATGAEIYSPIQLAAILWRAARWLSAWPLWHAGGRGRARGRLAASDYV